MPHLPFRNLAAAVGLMLSACATPSSIQTENIGAIRSGVAATRQQAALAFAGANDLARSQGIERKVRLPEQILRQTDFPEVVPAISAQEWDVALGVLDDYSAALLSLVDAKRAQGTGDAIGALGESLNADNFKAKVPSGLFAAFATLGQALVQLRAEAKAAAIIRATDPAFNDVINQMATAIGQPGDVGSLTSVVTSNWNNSVLPLIENDYGALPPSDLDGRRQLALSYVKSMGLRDEQIGEMIALQRSLLAIGEAHRAAATGKPGDALFWIGRINDWVDDAKARMEKADKGIGR